MREKNIHLESKTPNEDLNVEKTQILGLFDFCMFILIIIPSSVIFTAATWDLSDQLEMKYWRFIPLLGVTTYLVLNITPHVAYDMAHHFLTNKCLFSIFSKVYIYIFATCAVSQWNYVWEWANTFPIFNQLAFVLYSTVGFSIVLFFCKRLVNLIGGHSAAAEDNCIEDVFLFPTMFETEVSFSETFLYLSNLSFYHDYVNVDSFNKSEFNINRSRDKINLNFSPRLFSNRTILN